MSKPVLPSTIWELAAKQVGRRVLVFDSVASTNDLAMKLGQDPANDGVAVLARAQTAGRGQHGRTWQAPPGSSVLLSVVLFQTVPLRRPALVTAWAAVSVCETIRELIGLEANIKWPNDVLVQGRKVCGILIEQRSGVRDEGATIVGVGLNVRQPAEFFAEAGLPDAGSLFALSGKSLDSDDVARTLLAQLDDHYAPLRAGRLGPLESLWQRCLGLAGKRVRVELAGGSPEGKLREIGFDGLVLETKAGEVMRLVPEAIRHVTAMEKPRTK